MFYEDKSSFEIISVVRLCWGKRTAYALPREFNALSLRIRGNADFIHDGKVFHVEKNDVVFVPAGYDYTLKANADEEVIVIHFKTSSKIRHEIEVLSHVAVKSLSDLFQKIYDVWVAKRNGYYFKTYSIFYSILEYMSIQRSYEQFHSQENIRYAMDYIQTKCFDKDLSVKKVASIAGVSETYFRKIFESAYHVSPIKFITQKRIDYATELLESGYYTVTEVADLCGFGDQKYFSVVYTKTTGKTLSSVIKTSYKNIRDDV